MVEYAERVAGQKEFNAAVGSAIDNFSYRGALMNVLMHLEDGGLMGSASVEVESQLIKLLHRTSHPDDIGTRTALEHRALQLQEDYGVSVW
ncbi:hypothetical protein [Burkholderia cenocepacia]|uniref:hypothetical protein n=1 Tax=Burkholderia cenocepacia TaxID=95486 RepID=UPI000F56C414|nr:hypothetical protein [Burkholderia cenocepacia]